MLCETCAAMKLDRDKFTIQKEPVSITLVPDQLSAVSGPSIFTRVRSGNWDITLGTLSEIESRQDTCSLCWLIVKSLKTLPTDNLSDKKVYEELRATATCFLRWEIDGRAAISGNQSDTSNKTRRLHICWDKPELKPYESYLVLVANEGKNWPNSELHCIWKDDIQYLGRSIDPSLGKQSLAVSWMQLCNKYHDDRCNGSGPGDARDRFCELLNQSYFGVIDVTNLQLTHLSVYPDVAGSERKWPPYAALSYMWGGIDAKMYQTKRSNILIYKSHGGLESLIPTLPKTIRDAIQLVRQLGIQYIWIDSLCIVQDSPRSWRLNSENMDLIYGNAAVTICAADGKDADAGLRAMESTESNGQYSRECAPGLTLMLSWPPESRIRASTWNKRAWTFQERLLSPRCLVFVNERVYWQCRTMSMSQDIFRDGRGGSWSLDSIQAPLQLLGDLDKRPFWFYMRCVPLYTFRNLTFQGDILAAFNGVSRLMERYLRAPFIFGLPMSHLDLALLWQPTTLPKRLKLDAAEAKWRDIEFPSWSWCGWEKTSVSYMANYEVVYEHDTTKGFLDDVHKWLMNHTWIRWHIRDGHGNLRPLWDKRKAEECRCAQVEWRGYRGLQISTEPPKRNDSPVTRDSQENRSEEDYGRQNMNVLGQQLNANRVHEPMVLRRYDYRDTTGSLDSDGSYYDPSWRQQPMPLMERPRPYPYPLPRPEPPPPPDITDANVHGDISLERRDSCMSCDQGSLTSKRMKKQRPLSPATRRQQRYDLNNRFDELASSNFFDDWGRALWPELEGRPWKDFNLTTPENPYRVSRSEYTRSSLGLTDMPMLQFWTWKTQLQVRHNVETCTAVDRGLCKADIIDFAGDWCGTIIASHDWIENSAQNVRDFIALSEANKFTDTECPVWTYYIPKERSESEWDVYHVLAIKYSPETNVYERVALGKVFKAAFEGCAWTEIILG